jgi:hypothetical protein
MKIGDLVRIEGCALPLGVITNMRPMDDGTQYVTVYQSLPESTFYDYGEACLEVINASR